MLTHLIRKAELPHSGSAHCFEGSQFGHIGLSFFWSESPPGSGPRLHAHPYVEIFIIQEGSLTFTVGDQTIEATSGEMVIAPADAPHRFVNSGPGIARHYDLHLNEQMITEWLDD